jgi:hypothetical protein
LRFSDGVPSTASIDTPVSGATFLTNAKQPDCHKIVMVATGHSRQATSEAVLPGSDCFADFPACEWRPFCIRRWPGRKC